MLDHGGEPRSGPRPSRTHRLSAPSTATRSRLVRTSIVAYVNVHLLADEIDHRPPRGPSRRSHPSRFRVAGLVRLEQYFNPIDTGPDIGFRTGSARRRSRPAPAVRLADDHQAFSFKRRCVSVFFGANVVDAPTVAEA